MCILWKKQKQLKETNLEKILQAESGRFSDMKMTVFCIWLEKSLILSSWLGFSLIMHRHYLQRMSVCYLLHILYLRQIRISAFSNLQSFYTNVTKLFRLLTFSDKRIPRGHWFNYENMTHYSITNLLFNQTSYLIQSYFQHCLHNEISNLSPINFPDKTTPTKRPSLQKNYSHKKLYSI